MKTLPRIIAVLSIAILSLFGRTAQASLHDLGEFTYWNLGKSAVKEAYFGELFGIDLKYLKKWKTDSEWFAVSLGIGRNFFVPRRNFSNMNFTWNFKTTNYDLAYVLVRGRSAGRGLKWHHLYSVTSDQVKDCGPMPPPITINDPPVVVVPTAVVPEPGTVFVWAGLSGMVLVAVKVRRRKAMA